MHALLFSDCFVIKKIVYVIEKNHQIVPGRREWNRLIGLFLCWKFYSVIAVLQLCDNTDRSVDTLVVHVQIRRLKNTFHIGLDTCVKNSIKSRNVYTRNLNAMCRYTPAVYVFDLHENILYRNINALFTMNRRKTQTSSVHPLICRIYIYI